jgi:hypothetical protein
VETDAVAAGTDDSSAAMVTSPKTPPSLPSVESDAVAAGTDQPALAIVVPQGGTSGAGATDPAPGGGGELCLQSIKIVSPEGACLSN